MACTEQKVLESTGATIKKSKEAMCTATQMQSQVAGSYWHASPMISKKGYAQLQQGSSHLFTE